MCLLAFMPAQAQTVFQDFNLPGQYTGNFTPWNDIGGVDGGNYSFAESTTAGSAGGGGVSVFQSNDTTATYNQSSWDFSTNGAAMTLSVLVKANGQSSGNKVQLGILNVSNNGLNGNPGVSFESFRFIPSAATAWSLREQYRTNGVTAPEVVLGNVNVVAGRWYQFVVSLTNTSGASGNFNAAAALLDYGTDGQTPGTNVVTFPTLQSHTVGSDIGALPSVWAGLRAFQNAGIDAWDNFLVYTPSSPPTLTLGLTNTTIPAGAAPTFRALADGPGAISYSWFTNGILVAGASTATYTTPPLDASYTNISVAANNANGVATNSASLTVFIASAATLTNLPASGIQPTAATLSGQVTSTGGDTPTVTVYYGTADGGTSASTWGSTLPLGLQGAGFSANISGLTPGTTYFFAAKAVNAGGTAWAQPSQSFSTPAVTLAVVTNLPATNIQATVATFNGQVLSSGGDTPLVTLYYGLTNGGANASGWARSVSIGAQSGAFQQTVTDLSPNATWFFTAKAVNAAGVSWAAPSQSFTTASVNKPAPQAAVLTQHNDNGRTGMNLNETSLNRANVITNLFGLLFTRPVDDQVYAQPLLMTNVNVPGKGTHNLLLVATVNDTVYAFDADDASMAVPYWTNSLISPPNIVAPKNTDMTGACGGNYKDFSGNMGIVGTPVVDSAAQTLYLVARTREYGSNFVQRLHALDVATGLERPNSPVVIAATNAVPFDPYKQNQRPALLLAGGYVYVTWSSHCDWGPYHGWVIGYNTANLLLPPISFNATPSGSQAGVWMSNQGPAADTNGNVYFSTGNGTFDGVSNFGESFLKLSPVGGKLSLASWFAPYNWNSLNGSDADLGCGGVLLVPGTSLLLSGGKAGVLYLVNRDNMGGVSSGTADTNIIQSWSLGGHSIHGGPVWWDAPDGSYAYIWGAAGDNLRQYKFNRSAGQFASTNVYAQSVTVGGSGQPGGILSLSANGTNTGSGIVWAAINTANNANQAVVAGTLHAYDAQNIGTELWNSDQSGTRDMLGNFAKFVAPTVANGKVYMATFSNRINVYGLFPRPALNVAYVSGSVSLSWPTNYAAGYTLQASPALATGSWTLVTNPVTQAGGSYQVTLPASATAKFYRLQK